MKTSETSENRDWHQGGLSWMEFAGGRKMFAERQTFPTSLIAITTVIKIQVLCVCRILVTTSYH